MPVKKGLKMLVIGAGGREHAIVWKLSQNPRVKRIYCAPGNGGIGQHAQIVNIGVEDIKALATFAEEKEIDLTVVGPEASLVQGIVDEFHKRSLAIFGPSKQAAQLEGSKVFAKQLMRKLGVPTAEFEVFDDPEDAKYYIKQTGVPLVVKADGLCAGKGAIIASTLGEALGAVALIMEDRIFGEAGRRVVIERFLHGEEASILAFSDGEHLLLLDSCQDHKRAFDEDKGPNTGGMGAYSPAPVVNEQMLALIKDQIMQPVVKGMAQRGTPFVGILYAGVMLTEQGPQVLEFNVRFGDPETQAVLPRLKTDLVELIEATINERLDEVHLDWDSRPCVCVALASGGYPGNYEKGKVIAGLEEVEKLPDTFVFHAGTRKLIEATPQPRYLTDGGRVLNVAALGDDVKGAIDRAYEAVGKIHFDGVHYRKDIGQRALTHPVRGR